MKYPALILISLILFVLSCEKPQEEFEILPSSIEILSPLENISCEEEDCGCEDETCELKIIVKITNKEEADAAYILIDDKIIGAGLSDTLITYYSLPPIQNQTINLTAVLVGYEYDSDGNMSTKEFDSDNLTIEFNQTNLEEDLNIETVFMNVNDVFQIMRFPVTNRDFKNFLNSNQSLEIERVEVYWDNENNNGQDQPQGDPSICNEMDPGDQYEPEEWWYVNVTSEFVNENIPAGKHSIYKNANNPYDTNADFSGQAGKIYYDCETVEIYIEDAPNEFACDCVFKVEDEYLDHPVTGVTWVGANIYANYFGWRLPSVEQWEFAARGDSDWLYPWGNDEVNQNYANYCSIDGYDCFEDNYQDWEYDYGDYRPETSPVGQYNGLGNFNVSLSAYGLYDMAGNVWEYTSTLSANQDYYKKGGAYHSPAENLIIEYSAVSTFNETSNNTGFRCISDFMDWTLEPEGCTDEESCNFDPFSESDDNSCQTNDCNEFCGGFAFFDSCDVCSSGNTNHEADSDIDCAGDCFGTAFEDDCGLCSEGNSGHSANSDQDDCGECFGDMYQDEDGLYPDGSCNCFGAEFDECGVCNGGGQDADADGICDDEDDCVGEYDCAGDCNGTAIDIDNDGICDDIDDCIDVNNNDICDENEEGCYDEDGQLIDSDGDEICDLSDECPNDPDNDIDGDGLCADVDECPNDPDNDIDGDGLCADVDECPNDSNNDLDEDGICDDVDTCIGEYDECGICNGEGILEGECDCFGTLPEYYCFDQNQNQNCDCNNQGLNWGLEHACNLENDVEFVCNDQLDDNCGDPDHCCDEYGFCGEEELSGDCSYRNSQHLEVITGCSDNEAENYYCDNPLPNNDCVEQFGNTYPPGNLIDDGSCVVYGCTDDGYQNWSPYPNQAANNYKENATQCDPNEGSNSDCCEYILPVIINFGNVTENTMEILINTPHDVGGFQFDIKGTTMTSGTGGLAEDADFSISAFGETILGFSFSGTVIPGGSNGILTNIDYTYINSDDPSACFYFNTGAISNGSGDPLPVQFGDIPEPWPNDGTEEGTDDLDDCLD
tara:strand:+ start:6834 stop:10013 length:3180 start_codon:yes stop_codon:yes gene_type:complete